MATRNTVLEIDIVSDATDAAKAFDDVGRAAVDMGADVDKASRQADDATSRFDGAADGADNLASKSSQATGALGALSSGFELVGLEKYAGGLQAASMATDFFSGVGDAANLILESQAVQTVKNTALKVKDAVVTKAQAAATAVMTAGQWALNAAMSANPLALVVLAVVALVALLVILYKKNETVRNIIQAVGRTAADVFQKVVAAVKVVVGWVADKLGGAFKLWKTLALAYVKAVVAVIKTIVDVVTTVISWVGDKLPAAFSTAKSIAVGVVDDVKDKLGDIVDGAKEIIKWVGDKIGNAFDTMLGVVTAPIDAVASGLEWLIGLVEDLIGWIQDIDWPDPPGWLSDLGGFLGGVIPGIAGPSTSDVEVVGGGMRTATITVNGAVDPMSTALQLRDLLDRSDTWTGRIEIVRV